MQKLGLINIGVYNIRPHPDNPRLDLGDISELTESIKANGVLQNLTVMPAEPENYESFIVLLGHRRLAAAKAAGLAEVPCRIVEDISRNEQISLMLQENMQRNNLTIYEQSQSFQLMLDLGETVATVAEKTGLSESTVRHRVKLAELDQKLLKKKEEEMPEGYQLSLMDLYELEKVEDPKVRNRILKEANSSKDMRWKIRSAVEDQTAAKNKKILMKQLNKMGIRKAPEGTSRWSSGYEELKEIDLCKEIPKEIKFKQKQDQGQVFWVESYGHHINLICKVKKEEKRQLSAQELEMKRLEKNRLEKNRKKLNEILKKMAADRQQYIVEIFTGKVASGEEVIRKADGICRILLSSILNTDTWIGEIECIAFLAGKGKWSLKEEEKEKARGDFCSGTLLNQLLVTAGAAADKEKDLVQYMAEYADYRWQRLKYLYQALEFWGFQLPEEEQQVLDGTHELYKRKKEEKETAGK